jgi:nitrous oxidase accessory protein NosD
MTRRSGALALAALALLSACSAGAAVIDPGGLQDAIDGAEPGAVLRLAAGDHHGPIVIDQPVTIIGRPDALITAGGDEPAVSIMRTSDVTLDGVRVEGGETGIFVRSSPGVVLDGVEVSGSALHGIYVLQGQVRILDCRVSGLTGERSQGIEIANADGYEPSTVRGCVVEGPVFEGITAHVSQVLFIDNLVTGSERRGIVVTEMSAGRVEGNEVTDAEGTAYLCGDRSRCFLVRNSAAGVDPADADITSAAGHGVVVHFGSIAWIQVLSTRHLAGDRVKVMLDSIVNPEGPAP